MDGGEAATSGSNDWLYSVLDNRYRLIALRETTTADDVWDAWDIRLSRRVVLELARTSEAMCPQTVQTAMARSRFDPANVYDAETYHDARGNFVFVVTGGRWRTDHRTEQPIGSDSGNVAVFAPRHRRSHDERKHYGSHRLVRSDPDAPLRPNNALIGI